MIRPKEFPEIPMPKEKSATRLRSAGSGMMMLPVCPPAMLKVLVVAVSRIVRSSASGAALAITVCTAPGNTRSW